MSAPTVGAMFAGYGGLELAVDQVWPGARTAWVSEFDTAPSRILAQRFPDAPNHGDVTKIQWAPVCPHGDEHKVSVFRFGYAADTDAETAYRCIDCGWELPVEQRPANVPYPVNIITGGSPCQDLSHAGKRAGMRTGTRSGLWASMTDAIDIIRPSLVIWENVRGALSAEADSAVEPCPICVGAPGERVTLRALGRVLGDLAELGYDAAWHGLRAADVGAPHGRWRVFVLAWPAADTESHRRVEGWAESARFIRRPDAPLRRDADVSLLPTPVVNDMGASYTPETWDEWTARLMASHGNGNGHVASLSIEAARLLRTPTAQLAVNGGSQHPDKRKEGGHGPTLADEVEHLDFGDYSPAIARWSRVIGRPAPSPTEPTGKGAAHRLSPRFVEWMMGLPDGWVTDTATSRNEQLKALGNGVVPQQAAGALRMLLAARDSVLAVAA